MSRELPNALDIAFLKQDTADVRRRAVEVRREAEARLAQLLNRIEQGLNVGVLGLTTPPGARGNKFPVAKHIRDEDLFYLRFPYLFYELFSDVKLEQYDVLALSQILYLNYMLLVDRLMDGKLSLEPGIAFWFASLHEKVIALLAALFPQDSPFWQYFERCRRENAEALMLERIKHSYRVSPYSEEETIAILAGKSAMAKAGIAALAFLTRRDIPEDLIASCEAFHVGFQFVDNLQDWRNDYRDHLYSPLLTKVLLDHQLADQAEGSNRLDVNIVGSLIYTHSYAQETLEQAADYYRLALNYVREANCPAWQNAIQLMLQRCQEFGQDIEAKLQRIRQKRQPRESPAAFEQPSVRPETALQVFPLYQILTSASDSPLHKLAAYLEQSDEVIVDFWRATGSFIQAAQNNLQRYTHESPILMPPQDQLLKVCQDTLARCCQWAAPVQPLSLYLLLGGSGVTSAIFQHRGEWVIGIALDRLIYPPTNDQISNGPPPIEKFTRFIQKKIAYEYGRRLRRSNTQPACRLLDQLCLEGLALAFACEVCPTIPWEEHAELPASTLAWFERNKHYLWQEAQGFLASDSPEVIRFYLCGQSSLCKDEETPLMPALGRLLGYDVIANYRQLIGQQAWAQLMRVPAVEILNQGGAMAIAERISGRGGVRLDL